MNAKTLCVHFDGVLHAYTTGWDGPDVIRDGPVPGAMRWLYHASRRYDVCIYSSRSKFPEGIFAMENAIREWALAEGFKSDNVAEMMCGLSFPTQKPAAWLTIDDRCFCFEGTFPTHEEIDNFKPWNKR